MEYNEKLFSVITDARAALDRAQEILVNGKQEAEEACILAPPTFLFRSLESNIFGVVRTHTVEKARQILREELGESVELMRVDDDLVLWSSPITGRE